MQANTRSPAVLQAYNIDREVWREMRIECVTHTPKLSLAELIAEMWAVYKAAKSSNGQN